MGESAGPSLSVSLSIPDRPADALTGSQFVETIRSLPLGLAREKAILTQFEQGNVPAFMRRLCTVTSKSMSIAGSLRTATYWVTPDYLCVGADEDYVRCPMNPLTATKVANMYGACLVTRRMVNDIFAQADVKLAARTMVAGEEMTSTAYFAEHNRIIQEQLVEKGAALGQLVAGHKKDIVLCKALFDGHHGDRVAIYGWCRVFNGTWEPWQPLNPVSHDCYYADYSHGVRLVAATMWIGDGADSVATVLMDPARAGTVSDEGALAGACYQGTW